MSEEALDAITVWLERSRAEREVLSLELDAVESRVVELTNNVQSLLAAFYELKPDDGGPPLDAGLDALFGSLEQATAVIGASFGEASVAIQACANTVGELTDGCAAWQQESEAGFEAMRERWDDGVNSAGQAVDHLEEAMEGLGTQLADWSTARIDELRDAVTGVEEDLRAAIEGIGDAAGNAIESTVNAYVEDVRERIDSTTGGLLDAVEGVAGQAQQSVGEIADKLACVTDTLGKVVDIVEPVLPVLEAAASL